MRPNPITIKGVDMFCGCGGTSTGLIDAVNLRAEETNAAHRLHLVAINHDELSIKTHRLNHPEVVHLWDELENVDPLTVIPAGRLRLLVASPECTHFSNARGGEPMSWQSRATFKYVVRWASQVDIDDILLENVREFQSWGPLHRTHSNGCAGKGACQKGCHFGRPIITRKGQFFRAAIRKMEMLGYRVEHALLCAADYGDPTSRVRFFLRARKSKKKISWPTPTHSPKGGLTILGKTKPYRTAREIINWDDEGVSIFQPVHGPFHNRHLVINTMQRIFTGLKKFGGVSFVLPNEGVYRGNTARTLDEPLPTVTSRGAGQVIQPYLVMMYNTNNARSTDQPFPTQTTANHVGLAQASLIEFHAGAGNADRVKSLDKPLPTQDTSNRFGVARPFVIGQQSAAAPRDVDQPLPTVACAGAISLSRPAFILSQRGGDDGYMRGASVDEPVQGITTQNPMALVDPFLITMEHSTPASGHDRRVLPADAPLPTLTGRAALGKVEPFITTVTHGQENARAFPLHKPMATLTASDGWALIEPEPYLAKYYGAGDGQSIHAPMDAITTHDRFALCLPGLVELPPQFERPDPSELPASFGPFCPFLVRVDGRLGMPLLLPNGHWLLMDILFRMIKYPELARAHSLDNYRFVGSREQIVKQIGNSVPKRLAQALCYSALFS